MSHDSSHLRCTDKTPCGPRCPHWAIALSGDQIAALDGNASRCPCCGAKPGERRAECQTTEVERLRATLHLATDGLSWACGALEVHGYEKDNYARRALVRVIDAAGVRDMGGT